MIEQELFKKHFLGRDGFVWWVGQIADATKWKTNQPARRTDTNSDHKGFGERYRVRIMGYHTADNKALPDNDLPWATVMYPVTAGSGGGTTSESATIRQGNFVFGFFLDGEEGQVPVIMGIIGYNQYTAVMRNVPPVPFLPFDGYEKLDRRAQNAIKEVNEKPAAIQVKPPGTTGGGSPEKLTAPGTTPSQASPSTANPNAGQETMTTDVVGQNQGKHLAVDKSQELDAAIATHQSKVRRCGPNQMKGIQLDIKNLTQKIELINRDVQKWGNEQKELINTKQEKIQKAMDEATKFVSEKVKWVIKELRKNTIEKVNNAVKDTYFLFFPNERPKVKKAQDKALQGISCLFDKIIKGLHKLVGGFLKDLVSKIVNTAICVIENFVGGLLGKLAGFLSGALDAIMGPLNAILGLVGGVGSLSLDVIGAVFDTVQNLIGLFKCESKPVCPEGDQWSIGQGIGNNGGSSSGLLSIFNKAKELGSQAASTLNQVTGLAASIENGLNSLNFSDLFQDTCGVGALLCGPPSVTFFGGGGTGAAGNAIVSATGDLLGVDITSFGSGYTSPPTVFFDDPCGKGKGAVAKVVLNIPTGTGSGIGNQSTPIGNLATKLSTDTGLQIIEGPLNTTGSGTTSTALADYFSGITIGTTTTVTGIIGGEGATSPVGAGITGGTTTGVIGTNIGGITEGTATGATGIQGGGITAGTTGGIAGESGNDGITGIPTEISLIDSGTDYSDSSGVLTSGGTGSGLTVNVEVEEGDVGAISQISIYDAGDNYRVGDIISIGGGNGGTLKVDKVQGPNSQSEGTGSIAKIIVLEPGYGYLSTPNGDAGGDGRVWNTKEQTVVRRSNLDFDRPYDPGKIINLNAGDTITLPVGTTETISDSDGNILETIPGGAPYVVSNSGTVTAPEGIKGDIPLSEFPTASNGQYPVVLELDEVYVKNSGFGYSPTDKIVMEPDNGAILQPLYDGNGSVVGVNVLRGAEGFTEMPLIYVDTDTGYNAQLVPVFKVNRVGDSTEDINKVPLGQKVISVIDCVGKFK